MASPEDIVQSLSSMEPDIKFLALKQIKNFVIGSKPKKAQFVKLGVLAKLADILNTETESVLLIQAAQAIGSIAHDEAHVPAIIQTGLVPLLISKIVDPNIKVIEAMLRTLRIIYTCQQAPISLLFEQPLLLKQLVDLLQVQDDALQEGVASLLSRICKAKDYQHVILSTHQMFAKLMILIDSKYAKTQEAALDALASLCFHNVDIAKGIAQQHSAVEKILRLVRDRRPSVRLVAIKCVASLNVVAPFKKSDLAMHVIPVLIKLLNEESPIRDEAPQVLAHLIRDSEELQKVSCDGVEKLAIYLKDDNITIRMRQNVLCALASMCSLNEDARKLVIDSKLVPLLVQALHHEHEKIREASCHCLRGLSRSSKTLRNVLVESGVMVSIVTLLHDASIKVKAIAVSIVCNIVLDFVPMKQYLVEKNGVSVLVEMTQSMDHQLRLHSIWALKNLVFRGDPLVKQAVLKVLTADGLFKLLLDSNLDIQEQAMNLVRNFAHGDVKDVELLLKDCGPRLVKTLEHNLTSAHEGVLLQTLYVICNIAASNEAQKQQVMKPDILNRVFYHLKHANKDVRVASLFVVINLTWKDEAGVEQRIQFLNHLGCKEKLKSMLDDPELDVRDRVKQALDNFEHYQASVTS